ncbi:nicotinate-nucleotide--dimethylbenzimidazole phosphoribosyltransferase [Streptomyces sp. D2-8]|uniref:nicotinate-nucleotide--dimethylbenzimidazole phosphoribosyltransferase n=1 Tax=Streptomyces sp. D2-8 TaxID=2707767 RepID=UPI0020BF0077|nr:nicotinate-nucleotide--dimethylbenzimidazole phosphoribosyltransferase [Streptomyces sp. D2-8]MCK8436735.1 nicotinate-nucleotide--dimethylbenzimidazole phosphoribosyltransferase [Streptomyces sp. D2-8]
MTDTGQVPGEGLPESAGMVEQPGAPAPGAYTYLSETTAEDEDLLLLPGAQGAWGNEVPPPAPEPVLETVHQPGPHEISGRDSGSVDLGGVRLPDPPPIPPITPRRPLHLGPPLPDSSASPVRSLADRGPADAPVRQPAPSPAGPEYLDGPRAAEMPARAAAPWGAPVTAPAQVSAGAAPAETVVPATEPSGPAQAVATSVATETSHTAPPAPAEAAQAVHAEQPAGEPMATAEAAQGAAEAAAAAAGDPVVPGVGPAEGHVAAAEAGQTPAGDPAGAGVGPDGPQPAAAEQALPAQAAHPAGLGVDAAAGRVVAAQAGLAAAGDPAGAVEAQVAQAGYAVPEPDAAVAGDPAGAGVGPDAGQVAAAEAGAVAAPEAATPPASEPGPVADGAAQGAEPAGVPPETSWPDASSAEQGPAVAAEQAAAPAPGPEAGQAPEAVPFPEAAAAPGYAAVTPPETTGEQAPAQVPDEAAPDAAAQATEVAAPEGAAQVPAAGVAPEAAAPGPDATAAETVAPQPDVTAEEAVPQPPAATDAAPAAEQPEATAPQTGTPGPEAPDQVAAAPATEPIGQDATTATAVAETVAAPAPAAETVAPPAAAPAPAFEAVATPAPEPAAQAAAPADAPDPAGPATHASPEMPPEAPAPTQPTAATAPTEAPAPAQASEAPDAPEAPMPDPAADAAVPAQTPEAATAPPAAEAVEPAPAPQGTAPDTPAPTEDVTVVLPAPAAEEQPGQPVQGPQQSQSALPETLEPPAPAATVPAPRDGDAELAQNADDLDTRAAEQEDLADQERREESAAAVAEARQPTGPAAPGYDPAEREAVLKVMRERRDIRNGFRSDPIPHEVLLRVLEAAHHAPSVGHSQPWDFVVIRSADTRRAMHELAMRQRDAYAKSLPKGRAKQFKELKIEAILDTPVNIVVTADPTRGGRHTLGRHTQPQMAPYSAALAVENLWLAARAEGLGVGWVSFFDEREMVRALGLPEHLEIIAYLCVGYVDEFPDEPELLQAGWSKRRPLSWVVHEETYGRRALPGEEPHDLLAETVAQIRPLDAKALGEAWERQKRMTKPAGALGMLEIISAQLSGLSRQCPPPIPEPAAVAIFAGDHGVHAQGVTPWPQEVTAQMVANFLGGGAVCNAFATQVGAEVCIVDVGVAADLPATPGLLPRKIRPGTSDMTTGPAMTREEARQAIEVGIETARDLVAAGNKALLTGEMGIANTTASAALISVFTGADPAEVTGRGTGINDETLARKTEVVRRALELHQPDPADPIGALAAIGGFEHAAIVGLLLGGASLRTPVILDGVSAGAAALVARAIAPEVLAACIAGHRSAEPGHVAALNKLGLRPLVDLDLRLGEGTGALLALPLVQSTARAMHEVATFDSAGVTEK